MKERWFILGISVLHVSFPHLLVKYPDGRQVFTSYFTGKLPDADAEQQPVEFTTDEKALAFISHEKAEGSNWTYALWVVREPTTEAEQMTGTGAGPAAGAAPPKA